MKISIFGLGYVGCVSAACLSKEGHKVIGVDINKHKVNMLNKGQNPIIEKDLDKLIEGSVAKGNLKSTTECAQSVKESEVIFICVGTPSNDNGSLDLRFIKRVCKEIGIALRDNNEYKLIAIRSTILPGTIAETIIPILENNSNKKTGKDFGIVMNPEFLREGNAVLDFYNPPFILIGEFDKKSGDMVEKIYSKIKAPTIKTSIQVAEMVKYVSNVFHGLKIAFANEIGILCKSMGIDGDKVMSIFSMDKSLNISSAYLKPGFAFGGSCLPKDIRALNYRARERDVDALMLSSILLSNEKHIKNAVDMILKTGKKKIGVLGLSFKYGTDDLRESPSVILVEALLGKGMEIQIYDREVSLAKLVGSNKEYIEKTIPHVSRLISSSIEKVIESAEVIVITNNSSEFSQVSELLRDDQILIDFVRVISDPAKLRCKYYGICW